MADVYCDQSLVTGTDAGTSWTNAYKLLTTALNATNTAAGDTLWVKNNASIAAQVDLKGVAAWTNNPPRVLGVKSATSATPPANGDLIPGLRTGQTTRAYDQVSADAPPTLTTTSTNLLKLYGWLYIYGLVLRAGGNLHINENPSGIDAEECHFRADHSNGSAQFLYGGNGLGNSVSMYSKNCQYSGGAAGWFNCSVRQHLGVFDGCEFDIPESSFMFRQGQSNMFFNGCDFSAQSGPILDNAGGQEPQGLWQFNNCKIHASSALVTGSIADNFRTEFFGVSSATGKTTGQSFQEIDIITSHGDIVVETARVRTGGASDGASGGWSLAYTPGINGTRDNLVGLIGPKMAIEVTGDGTAQTLTVFIANSSASTDYQDDEVHLVVKSPSAAGTADYDFETTQMDLLATPSNITDDTGSTWGSGANNHQKLSVSISPDYDGFIECWVVFTKNFGASPETLYVDPLPVLT